ncbi:phospholipase D/nuclease [Aspergillus heterothallicus]
MNAQPQSGLALAARYAVPFGLLLIPLWMTKVSSVVPEPYLDEAFHIPQAQAYWAHKWARWDPAITTPPGLYLFSYAVCALILLLRGSPTELDPGALRATNAVAAAVLLPLRLQTVLDAVRKQRNTRPSGAWLSHTVLNICLFPPLFFFSGLYYTDVLALLVVVEAYHWDLSRSVRPRGSVFETLVFVALGVAALAFRQTNIFWVSVFFGGLQVVRRLRRATRTCNSAALTDIVQSGSKNELYDPLILDASLADYFKTAISLCSVALNNIGSIVSHLVPYLFILAAFGAFVLWNGSVVLGHKEFHSASLHLAQMLYIWPYFIFFSWPLLLAPLANIVLPKFMLPKFLNQGFPASRRQLPSIIAVLIVLPAMLAVVHFNTIVHPFTLADNRHYVFYVFRILLRSHPYTRYAATVVYFLGAWMVISAMGFSPVTAAPKVASVVKPQAAPEPEKKPAQKGQQKLERRQKGSKKSMPAESADPISPEAWAELQEHIRRRQRAQFETSRVSFVLVWLAATALSLITAPLVEPRYLIIPWVMWRLHLPVAPTPVFYRKSVDDKDDLKARLAINFPLFLETAWFLLVNILTGALFLFGGFEYRPSKRSKLSSSSNTNPNSPSLTSLHRSITPPPTSRRRRSITTTSAASPHGQKPAIPSSDNQTNPENLPSPIHLTHIRDFSPSSGNNVDCIRLPDILGDPLIRECWQFNYLFDVDFLMKQFDSDIRDLVKIKVVHGSWKKESENRIRVDEASARYSNVEPIVAYMPEPFGTHHSKMMILLRHDDSAQVIIHTANMIAGDWANMTQAVWRSPLLPLATGQSSQGETKSVPMSWGSGTKFKRDILAYLKEYGVKKTGPLVEQLAKYDFGAVRAAFIASVPSKLKFSGSSSQTDKWLKDVFFNALAPSSSKQSPRFSIIFPTAEEIRRSLNGYGSGGSIHMKLQNAAQQKQLQYQMPYMCHWAGDVAGQLPKENRDAGRRRAAPHIKTYLRFTDARRMDTIDWALVTSANLSTQAWGAAVNQGGEVRICSWEVGVLVWPDLFATDEQKGQDTDMVPCFKQNAPNTSQPALGNGTGTAALQIGFRMPYDLPLTPYSAQDIPWCATMPHSQPDWLGQTWEG